MDALETLKQQHIEAHAAFSQIKAAAPRGRATTWRELQPKLELHEQIEEQFVYDPVAADAGSSDPVLGRWEEEHEEQVREANAVIARIDTLDPLDDAWLEQVNALGATLDAHIAHEENDIWPRIRAAWDQDKLDRAGRQMAQAKASVEKGDPIERAVAEAEAAN
jgi:hemerythrin-like domain-containing protein